MTPKEQWEATQKANGLGITWEEHLAQREQDFAMAILNGLSGSNACKGADERRRMIPLHIADQAVAACDAEIAKLRDEVARLKAAGDGLYKSMLEIGCNEMADNFQYDAWWGSMNAWNAAKEGKGHA